MPIDKKGKFHLNTQKAMHADKFGGMPAPVKKPPMGANGVGDPMAAGENESDIGGDSTETRITHHGDGTHSVMHHDGEETGPHPDIEEALDTIHAKHSMGGEKPNMARFMHEEAREPEHAHSLRGM